MKHHCIFLATIAALSFSGSVLAAGPQDLNVPLPTRATTAAPASPVPAVTLQALAPQPAAKSAPKGPASNVDKILEEISRNMTPPADLIDSQAETSINRDFTVSRNGSQILRPIGFMQIENEKVVFASDDGVRVIRLKENSRMGVMKIAAISEYGIEYTVSGKAMYAPLAYIASDGPKGGAQGATNNAPASQPPMGVGAAMASSSGAPSTSSGQR